MAEIINLLPVLAIAVAMNIGAGLYYNIGSNDMIFSKKKLIMGIVKAFIICGMFVGAAYCFDSTDLSSIGVTPSLIMNTAIILYVGKSMTSLAKILDVKI